MPPRLAVLVCALGFGLGGCNEDAFLCQVDDDCASRGDGLCQPTGFCSFADEACESGQRYGEHGGSLAGRCVGDEGGTGAPTTGSTTASPSGSSTTPDATTTSTASSSGDVVLDGSSDSSTTLSESADSSSGGGDACVVRFDEPFDGAPLSAFELSAPALFEVADGAARFSVTPELDATNWLIYPEPTLGAGLVYRAELPELPSGLATQFLLVALRGTDNSSYQLLSDSMGYLVARRWFGTDSFNDLAYLDYVPEQHRWIQMREADNLVHFETSADGVTFNSFAAQPSDFAQWEVTLWMGAGNYEANDVEQTVELASAFACSPGDG